MTLLSLYVLYHIFKNLKYIYHCQEPTYDVTFSGQVLGSQGDPAEQPGRSCCFWTHPVGSGNFPGSRDRVPTITFTYSLPIKTCTMTV